MPRILQTVDDLMTTVRSQLDEANPDAVSNETELLPALNRGLDYAASTLARFYPEPLLTYVSVDLTSGTNEYDIPEDAFEDRLVKVEISVDGTYREVQQISYRDISNYEINTTTLVPSYYCIVGRKYRMVPAPSGAFDARVWYVRQPDKAVMQQGRVVTINTGSNYIMVDEAGSDLDTVSTDLSSYVNIVDGQTGIIKKSLQIQAISGTRITFRSSPIRSSVLGRTISSSFSATDIQADDYICSIQGSCVIQPLGPTIVNFIIQYAVNEITRRLGGDAPTEREMLDVLEKQVQRTDNGRTNTLRVAKKSRIWGVVGNKWWWPGSTR
jgi:hypothetical protein